MSRSTSMENSASEWHLDRKVPIGLILMIVVQTITLVYVGTTWKDGIDHRLDNLEKYEASTSMNSTRVTILEQQFISIGQTLKRIEDKIDKREP
jgi:hypothetical protein